MRDRRDARWLPSRFHFALFRLYAYLRLRNAKPEPVRGLIMSVDRDQSAAENFLLTIFITTVASTYFAALFERSMSTPLAYAAGVPAAVLAIQVLITVGGVIITAAQRRFRVNEVDTAAKLVSITLMTLMIAGGVVVGGSDSFARHIARAFLLLVATNAAAAGALFLLRNQIAELERRLGVDR